MSQKTFSCFLIGADSLLSECGEILLSKGHNILGVVTSAPKISAWAHSKSLPVIAEKPSYVDALKAQDGPLPAYAGLNTPAWALMHQESRYGISWHQIVSGVDKGDLLKQNLFDVSSTETSLSINTKCFAAALESFPVLVDELASGTQAPIEQDFSKRSYFGKFDRPENFALLDWSKSADSLEALVRALDFGDYPNLLIAPKIRINSDLLAITSATAQSDDGDAAAGSVLRIDEGQIDIACGEGTLSLTGFKTLAGAVLSPGELAKNYSLESGTVLAATPEWGVEQQALSAQLAKNDEFWAKHLAYLEPIELPYCVAEADRNAAANTVSINATANEQELVTALGILLARLNRKDEFDLAISDADTRKAAITAPDCASSYSVLHLAVDVKRSINELKEGSQQQLDVVAKSGEP